MRNLVLMLTLALSPLAAHAQQSGDPVINFGATDAEMNAAQDAARASLPRFLANALDAEGFGLPGTGLKVAFPVDNAGGVEVIWVTPFAYDGATGFAGLLANEPNAMDGLHVGDRVDFSLDMLRDWSFVDGKGTLYGNYTTRTMLPYLPADQAAGLAELLSPDPVPARW